MHRRQFLYLSGQSIAAALILQKLGACSGTTHPASAAMAYPDEVRAVTGGKPVILSGKDAGWSTDNLQVSITRAPASTSIKIQEEKSELSEVRLYWKLPFDLSSVRVLNDHWERTYGDVSWHKPVGEEILPWYFLIQEENKTSAIGVKTGAGVFCYWLMDAGSLSLVLDTRSGGEGVRLGGRELTAADIMVFYGKEGESAFQVGREFTRLLCDHPKLPSQPVYGINDWYYTYGNNSHERILEHTRLMAPLAGGLTNRPFSVIDAGWYRYATKFPNDGGWGDRMDMPNEKFPDMPGLCSSIRELGMRPGIWTRPVCGSERDSPALMLPAIPGRENDRPVLDPSIPENLERIAGYFKLYREWGFEMVKFDYTSYDIFGKWGFQMIQSRDLTSPGWQMNDRSKTNAEIINELYRKIQTAAADMLIIGCNTFSHLSAGHFELNRIGDDTSGREWERTRKMGVNTLAFRGLTQGNFYAADGDCVGLTTEIDWEKNKQWMELLAKSGTPLFISAQPEAVGEKQKSLIRESFQWASSPLPVGEPLDWMTQVQPKEWMLNGEKRHFDW